MAGTHWLRLHTLEFSTRGAAYGASYIDVNIMQPVQQVLIVLAVVAALGLVLGAVFNQQWLPIGGLGLWFLVLVAGAWAYPGLAHRLECSRTSWSESAPTSRTTSPSRARRTVSTVLSKRSTQASRGDARRVGWQPPDSANFRLWDPEPLLITYNQVQSIRLYYDILDVDVDRYYVDGEYRQVMVGARELSTEKLPASAQTWVNRRLQYTHGYGVVMSPVNEVSPEGLPAFFLKDVPQRASWILSDRKSTMAKRR